MTKRRSFPCPLFTQRRLSFVLREAGSVLACSHLELVEERRGRRAVRLALTIDDQHLLLLLEERDDRLSLHVRASRLQRVTRVDDTRCLFRLAIGQHDLCVRIRLPLWRRNRNGRGSHDHVSRDDHCHHHHCTHVHVVFVFVCVCVCVCVYFAVKLLSPAQFIVSKYIGNNLICMQRSSCSTSPVAAMCM